MKTPLSSPSVPTFDHRDPLLEEDPSEIFRIYREEDPVHLAPVPAAGAPEGWWIFRHADVLAAFRDPRLSRNFQASRDQRKPQKPPEELLPLIDMLNGWMLNHEPPEHTRLRSPVGRAFTPKVISHVRARLEEIVEKELDRVLENDRFDVIKDYALPFSVSAIAELLGVSVESKRDFGRWFAELDVIFRAQSNPSELVAAAEAATALMNFFRDLLQRRKREPQDDLASSLAALSDSELSLDDRAATCVLLLGAGHVTTVGLLGKSVISLARSPTEMARLVSEEVAVESAVEELLRVHGGTQARCATSDFEIEGRSIRKGQIVMLVVGSANRDPAVFSDPDRLDLARDASQHLTFGQGIHFCLGASLARAELQVALGALVRRVPSLTLEPDPIEYGQGVGNVPAHVFVRQRP